MSEKTVSKSIDEVNIDFIKSIKPDWSYFKDGMSDYSYACYISLYSFVAGLCDGKRVFDNASGTGFGSFFLTQKAKSVIGIDLDQNSIQYASERYRHENLNYIHANSLEVPLKNGSFDVIASLETLEHIPPEQAARFVQECQRLLIPGGILILSTPNRTINHQFSKTESHINEMTVDECFDLLSNYFPECKPYYQRKGVFRTMRTFYGVVRSDKLKLRKLIPRRIRQWFNRRTTPQLFQDMPDLLKQLKVHPASDLEELKDAVIQVAVCRKES